MKLLVVEDETVMSALLKRGLTEEGFAVDVAGNSQDAEEAARIYEYDLILLDVMLPGKDGFALCRAWREEGVTTPILFLTARDEIVDRVQGLSLGGDDYLVKPFAFEELLARVRALLRRGRLATATAHLHIGDLIMDTNRRCVTRAGKAVPLTSREYQLLEYMAANTDRVVTRAQLWEHVWESGCEPDSNVVDVYVRYLRNKLGRDPDIIETVRGAGYILNSVLHRSVPPDHAPFSSVLPTSAVDKVSVTGVPTTVEFGEGSLVGEHAVHAAADMSVAEAQHDSRSQQQ